jgi:hypothetical protein
MLVLILALMYSVPFQTIVEMVPNDYVEVWVQRHSGSGNILTVSLNLIVN